MFCEDVMVYVRQRTFTFLYNFKRDLPLVYLTTINNNFQTPRKEVFTESMHTEETEESPKLL